MTTLNDPTWVEAARALAQECMKTSQSLDDRLTCAFRRVMCRKPTELDLQILRRAYEKQAAGFARDAAGARAFLGVGESRRDDQLNVVEHAALSAVCLAILNLDEALTRE